jgi:hypothetical protein
MAGLQHVLDECLLDKRITEHEVRIIKDSIEQDGQLDMEDVKFLIQMLSESTEVCAAFDDLFFPVLKKVLLRDGRILDDEQFYLLKMLYSDGHIREREKQFLAELRLEAEEVPAAFDELCEIAFKARPRNWSVD